MMTPSVYNLFKTDALHHHEEHFKVLLETSSFRLEQITSYGTASPPNLWYNQAQSEWVMLAQGQATLVFKDQAPLQLKAGDHLLIPKHTLHRVEHTSTDAVWLALHFSDDTPSSHTTDHPTLS